MTYFTGKPCRRGHISECAKEDKQNARILQNDWNLVVKQFHIDQARAVATGDVVELERIESAFREKSRMRDKDPLNYLSPPTGR